MFVTFCEQRKSALASNQVDQDNPTTGEGAEWSNAAVLKTVDG